MYVCKDVQREIYPTGASILIEHLCTPACLSTGDRLDKIPHQCQHKQPAKQSDQLTQQAGVK